MKRLLLPLIFVACAHHPNPQIVSFRAVGTLTAREQSVDPREATTDAVREYEFVIDVPNRRLRREARLLYPGGIQFHTSAFIDGDRGFQWDALRWRTGTDLGKVDPKDFDTFLRYLPHLLNENRPSSLKFGNTEYRYSDYRDVRGVAIPHRVDVSGGPTESIRITDACRLSPMNYPLEPDAPEMHALVAEAMRRIVAHIESLPSQPAMNVEGAAELARTLIEPLPTNGMPYDSLLDFLFDEAIPRTFNAAGPGYLGYIPGGGIFHSAVADLIANAVNRYVGVFAAAPLLAQLEANVVRWFCEIVGYPPTAGGVLTSGGSLANFTALVTARKALLGDDFLGATLYCSTQVHHSFQKAANLAGFPYKNIREIAVDEKFRIRIDALEEAIAQDEQPFLIAGSAGTTGTGAVDDLEALAAVARKHRMWFHVDGAYGVLFAMTDRGRRTLKGIEQADSMILDPHKTLFLPFGTGAVLVRDARALRRAHSLHADYLPAMQTVDELVDFCEISPELSRDFRGLRAWLPLKLFGIEPFREQLDEKLDLIAWCTNELRRIEGIEIVAEPQLTITAFRLKGSNDLNKELLDRINAKKRVMLTPTTIDGNFLIRICIVSHRTHKDRVEMALDDIRSAVESL